MHRTKDSTPIISQNGHNLTKTTIQSTKNYFSENSNELFVNPLNEILRYFKPNVKQHFAFLPSL